jgi:hypothetical protein
MRKPIAAISPNKGIRARSTLWTNEKRKEIRDALRKQRAYSEE